MIFEVVISQKSHATVEQFWKAMDIWLRKPHLVNRRISSCINLLISEIKCDKAALIAHLFSIDSLSQVLELISHGQTVENALNITQKCNPLIDERNPLNTDARGCYLFVNKFSPRDSEKYSAGIEFSVVEKDSRCISCFYRAINENQQYLGLKRPYKIFYDKNELSISVVKIDEDDSNIQWLRDSLFPRLLKWIQVDRSSDDNLVEGSLNLVSPDKYSQLYGELKRKYGLEMVKKWPECTDPNKFVYEDVGIATYLLLLWEKERSETESERKQSFVDLGCGNGLLVYILTSEGHPGTGIDLRRRQIWDIYPSTTHLEERTIVPSSTSLFPEADWLIGNHSDELTPWIPVIASRSSQNCRFFLLPCCAHEFDGRKFQRASAGKSQYFEYLKYVKSICESCGFRTNLDKLRIPSTKRICLVGWNRTYPMERSNEQDKLIDEIINARARKEKSSTTGDIKAPQGQWSRDFKPRDVVEHVRNCTQLDRSVIDEIINIVTSHLMRKVRQISLIHEPDKKWNAGGQLELREIAKIVPPETLKQLRNECGGLQTLLKNNSHIFHVINGTVQFKVPGSQATSKKKKRRSNTNNVMIKVKPCWFYVNHPDGCPVSGELCNFKH